MPIIIKDYTWRQTDQLISIRIPIKRVTVLKLDFFVTKYYAKVTHEHFLWEACLWDAVDGEEASLSVCEDSVILEATKLEIGQEWPKLQKDLSKAEAMQVRLDAVKESQASTKPQEKKEKRIKIEKECVRQAIGLDSKTRDRIHKNKDLSKKKAEQELALTITSDRTVISKISSEEKEKKLFKLEKHFVKKKEVQENKEKDVSIPAPRYGGTIKIKFSDRAFPTPSRESQLEEENKWLKQQAEARRMTGFVVEDLRPEEDNPEWCLDKGRSMMKVGNYKGSISAFSHGIKRSNKMPELYVERSTAQLALGNYRRCLTDVSQAQELLRPHVEENRMMRVLCHYNCAAALANLGMNENAVDELRRALSLEPDHSPSLNLLRTVQRRILRKEMEEEAIEEEELEKLGSGDFF